jgi:hypothetical protein
MLSLTQKLGKRGRFAKVSGVLEKIAESSGFVFFSGAFRAKPGKFKIMTDYFENSSTVKLIIEFIQRRNRRIVNPAASYTAYMVVLLCIPVKTLK